MPKFILCHALYTKDKKVNLRSKTFLSFVYSISAHLFLFALFNAQRGSKWQRKNRLLNFQPFILFFCMVLKKTKTHAKK